MHGCSQLKICDVFSLDFNTKYGKTVEQNNVGTFLCTREEKCLCLVPTVNS